jgi:DnaK suppressor protein
VEQVVTEAQRKKLLQKLLALHAELTGKAPAKVEPNRTDETRVGGDEDEQPLNEMLQAIASKRNRNMDVVLQRVVKALGKLREDPDSFGECEECGDEIPLGRIEAMPYVEYCVACQGQKDSPKGGPTRRKLTDYT